MGSRHGRRLTPTLTLTQPLTLTLTVTPTLTLTPSPDLMPDPKPARNRPEMRLRFVRFFFFVIVSSCGPRSPHTINNSKKNPGKIELSLKVPLLKSFLGMQ